MPDKKPPQNPEFMASLAGFTTRRSMSDTKAADLMGVPVFTLRKWTTGERSPNAAAVRLLDVLLTLEALAPDLLDALMPKNQPSKGQP